MVAMIGELVHTLYDYNAWANRRVLDAAEGLTPEQYREDAGASFGAVHDTLVHVVGAQWLYLERWKGTSPAAGLDPKAFADLAAVRRRWDVVERETHDFVAALTDGDLARVVEYVNTQGERWAYPLWQQALHQVNHATQHRSEAAMVLTRFGHSPGWLDFLYYIDLRAERRSG